MRPCGEGASLPRVTAEETAPCWHLNKRKNERAKEGRVAARGGTGECKHRQHAPGRNVPGQSHPISYSLDPGAPSNRRGKVVCLKLETEERAQAKRQVGCQRSTPRSQGPRQHPQKTAHTMEQGVQKPPRCTCPSTHLTRMR